MSVQDTQIDKSQRTKRFTLNFNFHDLEKACVEVSEAHLLLKNMTSLAPQKPEESNVVMELTVTMKYHRHWFLSTCDYWVKSRIMGA